MEKNRKNIADLARKIFELNSFLGRISYDEKGLMIWNKGFIPHIAVRIYPKHDIVYVSDRKYRGRARKFAEDYKREFLKETQHVTLKLDYN